MLVGVYFLKHSYTKVSHWISNSVMKPLDVSEQINEKHELNQNDHEYQKPDSISNHDGSNDIV